MSETTTTNLNAAAVTLDNSVSALAQAISGYHQSVAAAFGDLEARLAALEAGHAEPQPEPEPEPEPEPQPEPTPVEPLATAAILASTGGEWDRGVSVQSARFLIADNATNQANFVVNNVAKFADGHSRKITAVTIAYGQIFVTVEGPVLSAATVGNPNSVEVYAPTVTETDPVSPPASGDLPLVGFNLAGLGNNPYVDAISTAVVGTHYRTPTPHHVNGNPNGQPDYIAAYIANKPAGSSFLVRLPFAGERIAILDGAGGFTLRASYVEEIRQAMDYAHSHGGKVLLDMHGYCRWYVQTTGLIAGREVMSWGGGFALWTAIGTSECPVTYPMLAQIWAAIAGQFKDHPALWGYGLMNEPCNRAGDMPGVNVEALWNANAQQVVTAVRNADPVANITICGNGYATAKDWRSKSYALKDIQDPAGKLFHEAHQYPDTNPNNTNNPGTGGGSWARPQPFADSVAAAARVQDWADWVLFLKEHGLKGFAGEFGGPADVLNMPAYLEQMHAFFDLHGIPRTQWLAGPGFGNGTYANGMNHESTGKLMPNAAALVSRIGSGVTAYGPN